jgi:transposase
MGERSGAYKVLVGKPERRRPLGRPQLRWRIILKWIFERLYRGMDWINLAQDKDRWWFLVNTEMNLRVP